MARHFRTLEKRRADAKLYKTLLQRGLNSEFFTRRPEYVENFIKKGNETCPVFRGLFKKTWKTQQRLGIFAVIDIPPR
jgi:hypothetical protein